MKEDTFTSRLRNSALVSLGRFRRAKYFGIVPNLEQKKMGNRRRQICLHRNDNNNKEENVALLLLRLCRRLAVSTQPRAKWPKKSSLCPPFHLEIRFRQKF